MLLIDQVLLFIYPKYSDLNAMKYKKHINNISIIIKPVPFSLGRPSIPFVISAIAFNGLTNYLGNLGTSYGTLELVRGFQIAWAAAMVLYVLIRFGMLFQKQTELERKIVA